MSPILNKLFITGYILSEYTQRNEKLGRPPGVVGSAPVNKWAKLSEALYLDQLRIFCLKGIFWNLLYQV